MENHHGLQHPEGYSLSNLTNQIRLAQLAKILAIALNTSQGISTSPMLESDRVNIEFMGPETIYIFLFAKVWLW